MTRTDQDDTGLDAFFDAARRNGAVPGPDLSARLLADALAHQPAAPVVRGRGRSGWLAALGGWPALGGLAAATVAGVWIGVAQPAAVGDLAFGGLGGGYDFSGFVTVADLGLSDG